MKRLLFVYACMVIVALFCTSCMRGPQGARGIPGKSGESFVSVPENGMDGSSCSTYPTETGAVIVCEDGTTSEIFNGSDGTSGVDGQTYCYKQAKKKLVRIECPGEEVE